MQNPYATKTKQKIPLFRTPLSKLLARIHKYKTLCGNRRRGNQQLCLGPDLLIEDLEALLDDINSHLTEEFRNEKNL